MNLFFVEGVRGLMGSLGCHSGAPTLVIDFVNGKHLSLFN